ncbi:MAG TPA: amino acid permease [Thermoplasmata archaeon]|nr:amino acid permease [Thermoplasmata archaeon]
MAAEAPTAEKTVFARKTSGLVKELGAFESFSINLISLGPGPAYALFLTLLVFTPGVNLMWATILGALVGVPVVVTYAIMAIEMPRSGGEYVYPSRLLHPYLGIVSGLSRMVNVIVYAAILPFWFSSLIVGPGLGSWGALTNNAGLQSLGAALTPGSGSTSNLYIVIIGEIVTFVLMALYVVMKPRLAFNLFSALLILELVGLLISLALLAAMGHGGFVNAVNNFMAGQGYKGNYYGDTASFGATSAMPYASSLSETLIFVPLVFAFYYMFTTAPNYIAGEFQRSSRSIRLGMTASYALSVIFAVAIVAVFENVVGMDFLNGAVWTSTAFLGGGPTPLPFAAGLTSLPMFAAGGNSVLLALMFLGATSWYLLWIILGFYIFSRYALSFSLDRLFPKALSAVSRRTHSPYAGIIILSVIGAILLPLVAYYYQQTYFPLVYLLFFLPMITVSLTSVSLVRLGMQKKRASYVVAGAVSFVATAVSAYLVSTLPDLGNAAGFTLGNQTTSYVTIGLIVVGSAVWYVLARAYNLRKHGVDVALAFKQLPPD